MTKSLRVSLTSSLRREPPAGETIGVPLLDPHGPAVCLGGSVGFDGLAMPVKPSAQSMFGPRGACLLGHGGASGPLWVCDTGHHRLLGWARRPSDDTPADWVIGQPGFACEGRNAHGEPSAATLNVPTGITALADAAGSIGGFAVADAWNHRVLIWHEPPYRHNQPADVVLGQADFSSMTANRGATDPAANTLFWPYGVHWDGSRLWVADTGNRRVLMWQGLPRRQGQPADRVLGQSTFNRRDENGGGDPDASSMRWPHAIALWQGRLCVADAGNNRIMVWNGLPSQDGQACDHLLGQRDATLVDHNQSLYWPNAAALNMPYGLGAAGDWLIVADTANSRLLGWHRDDIHTGAAARALTGQPDFQAKGDNRWQLPVRDSLCWPYALTHHEGLAVIADSGNNRVLLWAMAEGLR